MKPAALSHLDGTVGVGRRLVPCPHTPWSDEAVLRRQGLGLLHEPLPQIPASLAPTRARGQGPGARAFTETLEVAIPLWGPAGGEEVCQRDPPAFPAHLYALGCV